MPMAGLKPVGYVALLRLSPIAKTGQVATRVVRLTGRMYPREKKQVRSGPMSRVLSWTIIYLLTPLPAPSSAQPERGAGHTMALLFAFAPEGACQAAVLPRRWWSLAPPFQLFSHLLAQAAGVFFSAALSVGSPRLAVSQLPALWSPDFPHGHPLPGGPAIAWPTSQGRL